MPVGLRVALQLLTVFPAGRTEDLEKGALRAGWWFAPVSLLIGGGAALVWLASSLVLPYAVPEFLAVAALLILSGGLHFDGLLDATDALAASATSERRLEIMKDVRVGAFGVAAAVLVLLGKFVGLAAIAPSYRWQTIVVAVLSGAVTMVLLLRFFPYARGEGGLGHGFKAGASWWMALSALLLSGGGSFLLLRPAGLAVTAAVIVAGLLLGYLARVRLGGLTGDVYGAAAELGQVAAFIVAAGLLPRGAP